MVVEILFDASLLVKVNGDSSLLVLDSLSSSLVQR